MRDSPTKLDLLYFHLWTFVVPVGGRRGCIIPRWLKGRYEVGAHLMMQFHLPRKRARYFARILCGWIDSGYTPAIITSSLRKRSLPK